MSVVVYDKTVGIIEKVRLIIRLVVVIGLGGGSEVWYVRYASTVVCSHLARGVCSTKVKGRPCSSSVQEWG